MRHTARRATLAVFTAAVLAVTGCGISEPSDQGDGIEFPDGTDCDADDRRKREIPDCGRMVNGHYQEWSWVAAGKTRPPAGWTARKERTTSTTRGKTTTGKTTTRTGGKTTTGGTTTRHR